MCFLSFSTSIQIHTNTSSTIEDFLNQQNIRDDLGVNASAGKFEGCNNPVGDRFNDNLDAYYPTQFYIAGLLERGVRVLIYVGDYDWACNWVRHTEGLVWKPLCAQTVCTGRQPTDDA